MTYHYTLAEYVYVVHCSTMYWFPGFYGLVCGWEA